MIVIVAAAAPVWATVDAALAGRAAFGLTYESYRSGVEELLAEGVSMAGRLDTVALAGEPVSVLEIVDSQVLRVELPAQPNGDTGYIGFVDASHVGEGEVAQLPLALDAGRIFDLAQQFIGVPYLWGGIERAGIDCSGLIHMAARLGGRVIPRDAHYQWAATRTDMSWDELELGDILYFGTSASLGGIVHVGFWAGDGRMLHAPEEGRHVALESLTERQLARCVAFGRIESL